MLPIVFFAEAGSDDDVIQAVEDFVNTQLDVANLEPVDLLDLLAPFDDGQRILALQQLVARGVSQIVVEEALAKLAEGYVVEDPPPPPPGPGPFPAVPHRVTGLQIFLGIATTLTAIGVGYAVGKRYGRRI